MFCINCGKETEPVDSRCTHCGFDLAAVMVLRDRNNRGQTTISYPEQQ